MQNSSDDSATSTFELSLSRPIFKHLESLLRKELKHLRSSKAMVVSEASTPQGFVYRLQVNDPGLQCFLQCLLEDQAGVKIAPAGSLPSSLDTLDGLANRLRNSCDKAYVLQGGGARVHVSSNVNLSGLTSFLQPYYRLSESSVNLNCETVFVCGCSQLYRKMQMVFNHFQLAVFEGWPDAPVVATRSVDHLFYITKDGKTLGRYRYTGFRNAGDLYVLSDPSGVVSILFDASAQLLPLDIARSFRAILANRLEMMGAVSIHGAAIEISGKAWIICGEKGVGKTTNLIGALKYGKNRCLISNDRVFINRTKQGLMVRGSPHSIPVKLGTLELFRKDFDFFSDGSTRLTAGKARGYDQALDLNRALKSAGNVRTSDQQLYFDPRELVAIFDSKLSVSAPLGGILLPQKGPKPARESSWSDADLSAPSILRLNQHAHYDTGSKYWTDILPEPMGDPLSKLCLDSVIVKQFWPEDALAETWRDLPFED